MSLIGKILGGRYELIEKIGGGGMAVVYKAKCHLLNRYVALKILRPEFVEDEEFVYRFKRESQSAASLSHQNIVNIYDVGQEDDIHYIVMEYVKGETLKDYIRRNKRLFPEKATRIAIQICSALDHAHKNHIIHRDIKPQNILVGEDGTIKVTDFGIARAATSSTVTMSGTNVIGSVHYFSPEQARGGFIDEKSDIYSLGIALYEMVTGTVPFEGDSPVSIAIKHIQEAVKLPSEINPDVPSSLEDIILKAIEKDPARRYANAREMEEDLVRSLREPYGNFVEKIPDNSDAPTQAIPVIREGNEYILQQEIEEKNKGAEKVHFRIARMVIASIVLIGLFVSLFLIGRNIYNNNFRISEIPVPDVIRVSEEEARSILAGKGLQMIVMGSETSNTVPEGMVISQTPEKNTMVRQGSKIEVVISSGPKKIPVPEVIKSSYTDAANAIEAAGLNVGNVEPVLTDKYPTNFVLEQDPKPGQEVLPGTEVNLKVSKIPEPEIISVPSVIGLQIEDAEAFLNKYKLEVGKITYQYSDAQLGVVIDQSPLPESDVEEKTKIDLVVSKGYRQSYPKEVTVPLNDIEDNTRVRIVLIDQAGNEKEVYNQIHNKGETEITTFINDEHGIQTLVVYINGVKQSEKQINFDAKEEDE
jgi:serine/threonine protein kinase